MGDNLVKFYNERIKKEWKIAFIATMVIGLLTHIYKFVNILPNHDSIWNMYSDQNMIASGRWFLSIACGFSSYLDLPWVNGVLSLICIALTAVVIVEVFKISKPVPCILIGGLLVTFPAVTTTFFYEFTADGYMLAMLMSALAIYLTTLEKRKILFSVISIILLCLACGIYQAYISFALMIVICDFIIKLIYAKLKNKECFKYIGKYMIIFAVSLLLYYVVWKILMKLQGVTPTNYQGISSTGEININLSTIFGVLDSFGSFFIKEGIGDIYSILNIIFIVCLLVAIIFVIINKKIFLRKIQLCLLLLSCFLIPHCIYIISFTSPWAYYYTIMLQSFSMLYVFLIVIAEKYAGFKLKNIIGILLFVIIFNFSIMANKAYVMMDLNNKSNYALGVKIATRVEQEMTSKDMKVAIVGRLSSYENNVSKNEKMNLFLYDNSNLYGGIMYSTNERATTYMEGFVGVDYNWASDELIKELSETEEVKNMPLWPLNGSVKVVEDTVVVKLSEVEYK
ncbi:MAG: glucosyltransferase domain-containing protein [Acutalibacteraceae bacterium]|nr:glucosyltransferase domain-containing protein [Acutalibacteraceae bacterium]